MNQDIYIKLLEELLANISEGIHFVDQKNITQIYNHNMEKIEGMDAKIILGKNFRDIFKDIPEEESTLLKALKGISMFIASFAIAKRWKQPKCPLMKG